jgi:glycosyltransferase involved in cell wall biosynthesis
MRFPDLIFVSMENWDEIWRRNQFICSRLSIRFPGSKILFIGLPKKFFAVTSRLSDFPNIVFSRPVKLFPDSFYLTRNINEAVFRIHVRRLAAKIGIKSPVLWLNAHYAAHMVGNMAEQAVIYDITDDWISFPQPPALKKLIIKQDAELCRRVDAVIVCSQRLLDLKKPMSRNVHLIPNGVDSDHYARVLDQSGRIPERMKNCPKPILGYTGSVHSARLDLDLVEGIARRLKKGSIVFVGPDMLTSAERIRLKRFQNIFLIGSVPYKETPDYMRAFDVCIVPHRITPFTESLNPLKLWEYLASGKPIVSTNIAGFREMSELVSIAADAAAFVELANKALSECEGKRKMRIREARLNSWDARIDAVEDVIRNVS